MKKVLCLPYEKCFGSYARYDIERTRWFAQIEHIQWFSNNSGREYWICGYFKIDGLFIATKEEFSSFEAAQNYIDSKLIEEGYIILTQEEADKLSILI